MSEDKVTMRELLAQERSKVGAGVSSQKNEIPEEVVKLPSKGLVYDAENPLHMAETIDIRSMAAKDEDILSSPALLKKGTALSSLLKACITNKLVDPETMLVGDRNAVLIAIRNSSYGAGYRVDMTCPSPSCGKSGEHEFDMSKLKMWTLGIEPVAPGQNAFEFDLPRSKKKVLFKFMTGVDVKDLERAMEQVKKANQGGVESAVSLRIHQQVLSIDGKTDRNELLAAVKNMPAMDSRALRDYIDKNNPGVDLVQSYRCPSCDVESEVEVPLGTEFFWPATGRR